MPQPCFRRQARFQVVSVYIFMKESGVKAVAGAHGVYQVFYFVVIR